MTEELLPCPFCNGEATIRLTQERYYILCKKCLSRTVDWASKLNAIETWNRRA